MKTLYEQVDACLERATIKPNNDSDYGKNWRKPASDEDKEFVYAALLVAGAQIDPDKDLFVDGDMLFCPQSGSYDGNPDPYVFNVREIRKFLKEKL